MCPELLTVRYHSGKVGSRTRETFPEVGGALAGRQETWVLKLFTPDGDPT